MPEALPKRRRAQAERRVQDRSIATRERLLTATVEALLAVGYRGTSTQEVCRRAGVSRGTLLHHFPTRGALVAAAAEHVFQAQLEDFRARLRGRAGEPPAEREEVPRVRAAIRLLWDGFQEPVFFAVLEITVAARTDPELARELRRVYRWFGDEVAASFGDLFGVDPSARLTFANGDAVDLAVVPNLLMSLLGWLALDRVQLEPDEVARRLAALESIAVAAFGWVKAPNPEERTS